jgi:hypothetical protein
MIHLLVEEMEEYLNEIMRRVVPTPLEQQYFLR